jgi:effector-binding domain-containing protein
MIIKLERICKYVVAYFQGFSEGIEENHEKLIFFIAGLWTQILIRNFLNIMQSC